ncbi:CapA family protein [Alkaliphilus hydrothermalis]|uniref:Poly-gamma-glutamate synthesis protein (Capsule biosynthesis protein) n=1 Tax=Alkaliphilus hydrothermalis TaxID=1482730 RepID=A0ABS2NPE6_9FIRM|nr:CapA family protein [Alkaliphilus hydrothermalis]MBM7614818.1 poly-gamma-glutamate synthesis protein (capsule biosynthesis protein) [Alkaliphilus hydrothermalis]
MKKLKLLLMMGIVVLVMLSGCNQSDAKKDIAEGPVIPNKNQNQDQNNNQKEKQNPDNNTKKVDAPKSNRIKLIFAGDTMMDGHVDGVMKEKGLDYPLTEFLPILQQGDLVVLNLETSVGTSRQLMEKAYAFQTKPENFVLFNPLREKLLFSLANNHGMDGPLAETMEELNKLQYQYIGVGENQEAAFRPHVEEINGVSVAIFGVSRVIPINTWTAGENHPGMATAYTYEPLLAYIKEWREKVDHVIVFVHWGEELAHQPNQHQLNLDEKLVEAGVSLIIGAHPHVVQEIKWRGNGQLTAYSLGNFIFTTSRHNVANEFVALEVELSKEKIEFAKVWPGKIKFALAQHLKEGVDGQRILERLQRISPTIKLDEKGVITPKH